MAKDSYAHYLRPASGPDEAPLVVALHGTGGDEHQFANLADSLFPAATVLSPRGDVSEHGALRFFRRTGEGVYDMADLAARTHKMTGFLSAWKTELRPRKVLAFGYSNGANILASVAFQRPDLFDAIALLHPLIPFEPVANPALTKLPVLITAGRRDPICPAPLTTRLQDWFEAQGSAAQTLWHDGGHELRPTEIEALARFGQDHLT